MPYEMCEYYIKNGAPERYHGYHTDALIRYAVSGDDIGIFEILTRNYFSKHKHWYTFNIRDMTVAAFILFRRGRYDMLDILTDEFRKVDDEVIEQKNRHSSLHREVIRRCMNNISCGLYGEPMRGDKTEDFIRSSLYFAMITGDLKKCGELIANEKIHQPSLYIDSAIAFRDTDFLRLMLNSGKNFHPGVIIDNCDDPEARKYLCENFSEYLFIDGYKYDGSPMNAAEFIRHSVDPGEMLMFANVYLSAAGPEHFDEDFEGLPKIGVIDEYDIHNCFRHIETYAFGGKINIKSILADEVLCIARYGSNVYRLPDYFTVDLSFMEEENNFLRYFEADEVTAYINNNNLIFDFLCLGTAARKIYDYDDEMVIGAMISKGHINEENAEWVLSYLSEKKLYNAFRALIDSGLLDRDLPV